MGLWRVASKGVDNTDAHWQIMLFCGVSVQDGPITGGEMHIASYLRCDFNNSLMHVFHVDQITGVMPDMVHHGNTVRWMTGHAK